jgi:hypothetical protein
MAFWSGRSHLVAGGVAALESNQTIAELKLALTIDLPEAGQGDVG